MKNLRWHKRVVKFVKVGKGVSQVVAVLLMIAIAVIAALVAYFWVMGYFRTTSTKVSNAIQIQNVAYTGTHLVAYVQNVGKGTVHFVSRQCLYVDGALQTEASISSNTLQVSATASVIDNITLNMGQRIKLKIVTSEGTFVEAYFTINKFTGDYTLSLLIIGNGNVMTVPSGSTFYYDNVSLTATPDTHWTFSGWGGDLSGTANPTSILVDRNRAVTATFVAIQHTVTFDENGVGQDFTNSVVTVDGSPVTSLPASFIWNEGSQHSFTFNSPLPVGTDKQYVWTSTSGLSTQQTDNNLIVPNGDGSVNATYGTQYNVTVTASPAEAMGGTFKVTYTQSGTTYTDVSQATEWTGWADANTVATVSGAQATISGSAGTQYVFDHYNPSSTVTMNQANTITLVYMTQYQVTIGANPSDRGTTNPSGLGWYDAGSVVPINATAADQNSKFSSWNATGSITCADWHSDTTTATIDGSGTITANFNVNTVQITITSNPAGPGFVNVDGTPCITPTNFTWFIGDNHTLNASSVVSGGTGVQYVYTGWSDSGAQTHTYTVPNSSATVTAIYKTQYQVSFVTSPNGYGTTNPNVTAFYDAGTLQISASANTGYRFAIWSVTGPITIQNYVLPSTTATISGPGTITANFALMQYTLAVNVSPLGSGIVNLNNTGSLYYGDVVQLTAVPANGWSFSGWSGNLGGSANPTTILMDGDKTVTATFTQNTYTITVNVVGQGSVTRNATEPYVYGQAVNLTAALATGWSFSAWSQDLTGSANPATLIMTANKTVTATFIQTSASKLVYITGTGQSLTVGQVSSMITVQRQDSAGNPFTSGTITVNLTSNSSRGRFYSDANGNNRIYSVQITDGQSSASFYYIDYNTGTPILTSSSGSLTPATTIFTINNYQLAFTDGYSQTLAPGSVSARIRVQSQDQYGNSYRPSTTITVNLTTTSPGGAFYSDSGGTTSITSITIGPSSSYSAYFYYKDSTVGTPTLTASATGYTPATTMFTILSNQPAARLVFTSGAPQSLVTGTVSSAITVQRQDQNGMPVGGAQITVGLASSSNGGFFFSDDGRTKITSVTISSGSTSATFYYADWKPGTPTLTASSSGLTSATSQFTITGQAHPFYDTAITPTSAPTGSKTSFTYTVTLDEPTDWFDDTSPTVAILGYFTIQLPTGFTSVSVASPSGWTASYNSATNTIMVHANSAGQALTDEGDQVSVTFSAVTPSSAGTYGPFTSTAYQNIDGSGAGPGTNTSPPDPSVTIYLTVNITITSSPAGSGFVRVDGNSITTPQTFNWASGSTHSLQAISPVSGGTGTQYVWTSWSDSGSLIHTYTVPNSGATVTAVYATQYQVTVTASPSGAIGGTFAVTYTINGTTHTNEQHTTSWTQWTDASTTVTVGSPQSPFNGYTFTSYTNNGATMNSLQTITLNYQSTHVPPSLDVSTTAYHTGSGNSYTISLTTANTNEIMYIAVATHDYTASVSGGGLTWTQRGNAAISGSRTLQTFWALKPTSGSITVTITLSGSGDSSAVAFAVVGANTASPFETTNPSQSTGTNSAPSTTITTTNPNDFIIGVVGVRNNPSMTKGASFTLINSVTSVDPEVSAEYETVTTTQTNLQVGYTLGSSNNWAMIADAIKGP